MELTHFDKNGKAIMVDVSEKTDTVRTAIAKGSISMSKACFEKVEEGAMGKGDVLGTARIAGIMGAKKTAELIPLCHSLMLSKVELDFCLLEESCVVEATCKVKTIGKTGVEMEALAGVNIALLTIYDMCKAVDKSMVLFDIKLVKKNGGKSGDYINEG